MTRHTCVCVGETLEEVSLVPGGSLLMVSTGAVVQVGEGRECVEQYRGRVLGMEAATLLNALHYLTGGAVGFARGLNDTPKIVAFLLVGEAIATKLGRALVSGGMASGRALKARRGAETMSRKITAMNAGQGFTNLVPRVWWAWRP